MSKTSRNGDFTIIIICHQKHVRRDDIHKVNVVIAPRTANYGCRFIELQASKQWINIFIVSQQFALQVRKKRRRPGIPKESLFMSAWGMYSAYRGIAVTQFHTALTMLKHSSKEWQVMGTDSAVTISHAAREMQQTTETCHVFNRGKTKTEEQYSVSYMS